MKGGYYTDDGQMIDPDSAKLPDLCFQCSKNGQSDEEIPCNLNRIDQAQEIKQGRNFICGAYQSKNSQK